MKIVDLFSGIGGFSYAAEKLVGGFETIAFIERDEYCQKVLRKHWHDVPIYDDIRSFNGKEYKDADVVVGGFPCQPWSVAGSQKGSEDDRDLWHEMVRVIEDIRPRWIIGENVSGFVAMPMGLTRSLADLESIGYKAIPYLIPASAVDAKHRRMRCWIVGHSEHDGSSTTPFRRGNEQVNGRSPQGQNQTWESEGASRRADNEPIQTDIFNFVADPNNAGDRTPRSGVDTEQQEIEQEWTDISQSESSGQREDVANTENRRGEQTEWQRGESISGRSIDSRGDKTEGQEDKRDVPNTKSKGLERRLHSSTISKERNEGSHSGDICSGKGEHHVADTDNKGVRTRINTHDGCIQKESGSRRNDRTNGRENDGRNDTKTTTNAKMGLSEKGVVPYTISKRGCSGSTRGQDAEDVGKPSFRERPVLWDAEPSVGRVANGIPNRVHRLRCLGNSIVPQVVARIFYAIKEAENEVKK